MSRHRYDVAVVGSGPSGSVAALALARGGARVVLIDKAAFPRDKACGDLVGPRGVQLLSDLGLHAGPSHVGVGDMVVLGPTGGRARLRARAGSSYPGQGWALPRKVLDAWLHDEAIAAGAEWIRGRATGVTTAGVVLGGGTVVEADTVIGADGANSVVAAAAGLLDPARILWGFAVRTYLDQAVEIPVIAFWDQVRGRGFPGYGWLFPLPGGRANAGLGLGVGSDRRRGSQATRHLDAFLAHLATTGLLGDATATDGAGSGGRDRLGGWLKMGIVGTTPAAGRVLLVGDAAGLVNPLQGEGIADGMDAGRAAAAAVLAGPSSAATTYRRHLRSRYLTYHATTAGVHGSMLDRPRVISVLGRALTAPGVGRAVGGAWALFWNDLVDGAAPCTDARLARLVERLLRTATARGANRRWLADALAEENGGSAEGVSAG